MIMSLAHHDASQVKFIMIDKKFETSIVPPFSDEDGFLCTICLQCTLENNNISEKYIFFSTDINDTLKYKNSHKIYDIVIRTC